MVFCSGCGTEYVHNAKFCHKCGKRASQIAVPNDINDDTSVSTGSGTTTSASTSQSNEHRTTSDRSGSSRLSFSAYRMKKEQERSSCSPKGPMAKKSKKAASKNTTVEVKVNVGIMTLRDGRLLPKRNTMLPLTVNDLIGSKELLEKAVEKHSCFNSNLISNIPSMYKLLYGNIAQVQEAKIIPGSKEAFSLKRYKEEIGKPYSKISFYICPLTDFLEDFVNSSSSSDEQMCDNSASDGTQEQNQSSSVEELTVISPNPTIPTQSKTVQCPFCLNHFSVQEVQHHVEQCSEWLLNEDHEVLEVNNSDNEQTVAESQVKISDMGKNEIKEMLKDEVAQVSKLDLQQEGKKRVTVRRKNIWEDFKDEIFQGNRITPSSKIKVVFSGEPAVDDGGPRRELFSDLLSIIKRRYFHDGSPVKSTIAISNGDFKLCGIIMGMSIKQGGPAPNFMTHAVSCFFTGCEMLTSDVRSSAYQDIVTCLSNATTDEQVIGILTKDSSLDILQELGYTSVPHMETIATAKRIVQSLCMKDQIGDVLAELMEIKNGLEACGISSDTIKKRAELWQIMFKSGSFFSLPAEEFLDELIVVFSESQIRKNAEIDVYKFFCDAMLSIENGSVEGLRTADILKWMTGSDEVPPLGFPKQFELQFTHGCNELCKCRPTVSTCDMSVKMPVHISTLEYMKEILYSAVKDSHGFGNL